MSFRLKYILLTGLSGTLFSCVDNKAVIDTPVSPSPPDNVRKEIRISPCLSDSRADESGFEQGDCIGLYVVNHISDQSTELKGNGNYIDNLRFTLSGDWIPDTPAYWIDDETHADFYIYYPYSAVADASAYQFSVKADQSSYLNFKASDMIIGKTSDVTPSVSCVNINAHHLMSKVHIVLTPGDGFTQESLKNSDKLVKINGVKINSQIDFRDWSLNPVGITSSITPLQIEDSYQAILIPQTVEECNLISIRIGDREYNLKKSFTFESGKNHKFEIIVNKTSSGLNINVNPWDNDETDNGGIAE